MDRFALEHTLRDASSRIVACQQALLDQRSQVRELERCGLDASMARALLEIYEESKAMAVFNRDCLTDTLRTGIFATAAPAHPSINDDEPVVEHDLYHRLAA